MIVERAAQLAKRSKRARGSLGSAGGDSARPRLAATCSVSRIPTTALVTPEVLRTNCSAQAASPRAWKRRDGGRVVVRLDLHHQVDELVDVAVGVAGGVGEEPARRRTRDDGGVVRIGAQHAAGMARVRVADHLEQAEVLIDAVEGPPRVEDLVTAVLRVRLGEHHELDVVGGTPQTPVGFEEVVDLRFAEREPEAGVRLPERRRAVSDEVDGLHRGRRAAVEQPCGSGGVRHHALGHPIAEHPGGLEGGLGARRGAVAGRERVRGAALDALDRRQVAPEQDLRRLARPR